MAGERDRDQEGGGIDTILETVDAPPQNQGGDVIEAEFVEAPGGNYGALARQPAGAVAAQPAGAQAVMNFAEEVVCLKGANPRKGIMRSFPASEVSSMSIREIVDHTLATVPMRYDESVMQQYHPQADSERLRQVHVEERSIANDLQRLFDTSFNRDYMAIVYVGGDRNFPEVLTSAQMDQQTVQRFLGVIQSGENEFGYFEIAITDDQGGG